MLHEKVQIPRRRLSKMQKYNRRYSEKPTIVTRPKKEGKFYTRITRNAEKCKRGCEKKLRNFINVVLRWIYTRRNFSFIGEGPNHKNNVVSFLFFVSSLSSSWWVNGRGVRVIFFRFWVELCGTQKILYSCETKMLHGAKSMKSTLKMEWGVHKSPRVKERKTPKQRQQPLLTCSFSLFFFFYFFPKHSPFLHIHIYTAPTSETLWSTSSTI